jgi:hypothetical protein
MNRIRPQACEDPNGAALPQWPACDDREDIGMKRPPLVLQDRRERCSDFFLPSQPLPQEPLQWRASHTFKKGSRSIRNAESTTLALQIVSQVRIVARRPARADAAQSGADML